MNREVEDEDGEGRRITAQFQLGRRGIKQLKIVKMKFNPFKICGTKIIHLLYCVNEGKALSEMCKVSYLF